MKSKRVHISVKAILVLLIILCASSAGINFYLHKNYKEAFAKDESYIEDGKSELIVNKKKKYSYRINKEDNSVEIIAYLKNDMENLEVPETIDGLAVTSLGEASFAYHEELKSVKMPKTINTIKMAVFGSCVNLKKVYFPEDIATIDDWAFGDFTGTVVTVKDYNLYNFAKSNGVMVEDLK